MKNKKTIPTSTENLWGICQEIYEGLTDKKSRNLIEDCWHVALHNALHSGTSLRPDMG